MAKGKAPVLMILAVVLLWFILKALKEARAEPAPAQGGGCC